MEASPPPRRNRAIHIQRRGPFPCTPSFPSSRAIPAQGTTRPSIPHPTPCFSACVRRMRRGDTGPLFSLSSVLVEPTPPSPPSKSSIPSVAASIPVCVGREKRSDFGKSGSAEKKGRCQNSRMDLRFINCTFVRSWYIGSKKPFLLNALFDQRATSALRQRNDTRHFIFCPSDQGSKRSNSSSVKSIFWGGLNIARTRSLSAFFFLTEEKETGPPISLPFFAEGNLLLSPPSPLMRLFLMQQAGGEGGGNERRRRGACLLAVCVCECSSESAGDKVPPLPYSRSVPFGPRSV